MGTTITPSETTTTTDLTLEILHATLTRTTAGPGKFDLFAAMKAYDALPPEQKLEAQRRFDESRERDLEPFLKKIHLAEKRGFNSLAPQDWDISFDHLEVFDQNKRELERLRAWTPSMEKGVVLYGSVGTGKSTAAKAIVNRYATSVFPCLFKGLGDAMQDLKDAIKSQEVTMGMIEGKLISPSLLVLDDLGSEKSTEWAREKIFSIFEARAFQRKHTFFTTNLMPDDIKKKYGPRIHDRMVQYCSWVKMEGKSFRQMKFKQEI